MTKKAAPTTKKTGAVALPAKERKRRSPAAVKASPVVVDAANLLSDLRGLIQSARQRITTVAYSTQTLLCWHLGRRLLNENLQGSRAAYGKQILVTVSRELTVEAGQSFTLRALDRALRFCQSFPDQDIVSTLSTQLSWSHFMELLPIKDPLARDFYAEMCRIERWDVRTLGISTDILAIEKKTEGLLDGLLMKGLPS